MRGTFSIASYNVQAGIGTKKAHHYITRAHNQFLSNKAKRERLHAIGRACAAFDIVCLQEVDLGGRRAGFENQVDLIQAGSGHDHAAFQENRTIRALSKHGNAILSRYALSNQYDLKLPGRIGGRGALIADVDMDPSTIIVTVHLSLGEADQTEQLDCLADHLQDRNTSSARVLVLGDLNCPVNSAPLQSFAERTGIRAVTHAGHKTFPSWTPRAGLDHILASHPDQAADVRVETIQLSDHRPVSASFPYQA